VSEVQLDGIEVDVKEMRVVSWIHVVQVGNH
jgi:hypothetical protein